MVLQEMKFGERFLNAINVIYSKPGAKLRINSPYSSDRHLERGTQQGCHLPPLLFAIAIEMLAADIWQNQTITVLQMGEHAFTFTLFADHMMLYLTNLVSSVATLQEILQKFSIISGLYVNQFT